MIQLTESQSGRQLGTITDAQLEFLEEWLEEESAEDQDYYLTSETVDMLEEEGGDAQLIGMLRQALDGREAVEIRWSST
jgi:hypothetical protein